MLSEAQLRYIEQVLGVSPDYFALPSQGGGADNRSQEPRKNQIIVLTGTINPSERELLGRILEKTQLHEYHHNEDIVDSSDLNKLAALNGMATAARKHVLAFLGEIGETRVVRQADFARTGSDIAGAGMASPFVWWNLPKVADMLGSGDEVVAKKKQAWTLLQKFIAELRT